MQLHEFKHQFKKKSKKRIGRGGKRGTYSGHGLKGQKSRAGHRIRPAERDLIQRLPKLRGFKNKPLSLKAVAVNLSDLDKITQNNIINKETLLKSGLIKKSTKRVKILGGGEIKRALIVDGLEISKSAEEKIKNAGGKIINNK